MRIKTILATLIAFTALAAVSACSGSDNSAASFNGADVTFAQDMIPHHRQATEMAKLAAGRTENPRILELADEISAAQQPEIDTMSGWLKSWEKKVPSDKSEMSDMGDMDHGSSSDRPGMMGADDMSSLEAASGTGFDKKFLTMMMAHHKGAIEMAKTEEADGKFPDAVSLAKKIQTDQAAEVATMENLLQS